LVRLRGPRAQTTYAEGYSLTSDQVDPARLNEAAGCAAAADVVILAVGLTDTAESEGYDRSDLSLPLSHVALIEAVTRVNPHVVVVLSNGAPVEMPWIDQVAAVLECYLGGQAGGGGAADVLTGYVNPSGRLAETFPVTLAHNPSYLNFPGDGDRVEYHEGVFVGYRYYDAKAIEPLFPFGHGLSYTTFSYHDLALSHTRLSDRERLTVSVSVTNTGSRAGYEVVQLYVAPPKEGAITRPIRQLRGFEKVWLDVGQTADVSFQLEARAFSYYDVAQSDWMVAPGQHTVAVGRSSRDLVLSQTLEVYPTHPTPGRPVTRHTTLGELLADPATAAVLQPLFEAYRQSLGMADSPGLGTQFASAFLVDLPLRAITTFAPGQFQPGDLDALIARLNAVRNVSPES
jgi:beta-glucosidase